MKVLKFPLLKNGARWIISSAATDIHKEYWKILFDSLDCELKEYERLANKSQKQNLIRIAELNIQPRTKTAIQCLKVLRNITNLKEDIVEHISASRPNLKHIRTTKDLAVIFDSNIEAIQSTLPFGFEIKFI